MKGILNFLAGIALGGVIGWGLGYLRFPLIEKNGAFTLGFLTCVGLMLAGLGIRFLWNKTRKVDPGFSDRKPGGKVWFALLVAVICSSLIFAFFTFRKNQELRGAIASFRQQTETLREMEQSRNEEVYLPYLTNLLEEIRRELDSDPERKLSDSTLKRITSTCSMFRPWKWIEVDSITRRKVSPERGQLLVALASLHLDSATFASIKATTSFLQADLNSVILPYADLSGADLRMADLSDADLTGADLSGANLESASLCRARMEQSKMPGANLHWARLTWALLNKAKMNKINLNGADLSNAQLRDACLREGSIRFAFARGVLFINADLFHVDMLGTRLSNANFSNANFTEGHLRWTKMENAVFTGTNLYELRVNHGNWKDNFLEWSMNETRDLSHRYRIVRDSTERYDACFMLLPADSLVVH